jgi:ubiquinone/menaquinone biosynthesis C-methylase UbiE
MFSRMLFRRIVEPLFYRPYVYGLGLGGDERVIEYGSGSGSVSRYLATILSSGSLTCVDISESWMRVVTKRLGDYKNVEFKLGDISELQLHDGVYDGVVVHFVLHDIDPQDRVSKLCILADKLKKGGKLYIREPTRKRHGMSPEEIRKEMATAHLTEKSAKEARSMYAGPMFEGIYVKE